MELQGTLAEARPKIVKVGNENVKVLEVKLVLPYASETLGFLGETLGDPVSVEMRSLQETLAFDSSEDGVAVRSAARG